MTRGPLQIYVAVHTTDSWRHGLEQAKVARAAGADGVVFIDHRGKWQCALDAAAHAKTLRSLSVGVNLLGLNGDEAFLHADRDGLSFCWSDTPFPLKRRHGGGYSGEVRRFGPVRFKYQKPRPLDEEAREAIASCDVAVTSGPATGVAPSPEKLAEVRAALLEAQPIEHRHRYPFPLWCASGVSEHNIAELAPHLDGVIVASSVGRDFHHIDEAKLTRFVQAAEAR